MVSPFIFLLFFLARSIPLAELRQHSAQARGSLSSVAVGAVADGDCTFQDCESLLNDLVEGVQILWRLGVKELSQCLEVGINFSALGLGQASFFVEGSHYSGGDKFEGVKFLPELSRLLVASGDFFRLHQNLAVQRFDCIEELPIVFERDSCGSSREGEEIVGVRVELDALVLRVGFEGEKSVVVEVGVVECQSFVGVHDCSWLLDRECCLLLD